MTRARRLPWGYWLALLVLAVLAMGAAGCASNKVETTIYGSDGKTPAQKIVTDMSDAALHNQARQAVRLQALAQAKPIGKIVIPAGATLEARGGDVTFEVNVPVAEHMVNWAQYKEPWLEAVQTAGGIMTTGILGYVLGFGDNFAARSNGPINYNTNASGGSGINAWSPSGSANPATSVPTVVTQPAPIVVTVPAAE
ncbi:MAG: hypothetical protein ACOZHQ_09520 [Thermodesulfobacteriota bacterium]